MTDKEFELRVLNFAASRGFGRFVLALKNYQPEEQQSCNKRTWVGLTEEEITEADLYTMRTRGDGYAYARAIEAKLKEKNT